MSFLGYEYFCGANVVLEIEGIPLLECAGMSVNISESKMPIYGYSSRHFDAVARGQVIVQGTFIVNYVNQNYVFRAIELGLEENGLLRARTPPALNAPNELAEQLNSESAATDLFREYITDPDTNQPLLDAARTKFWDDQFPFAQQLESLPNPHDSFGGLDMKVTFGPRDLSTNFNGATGFLIQDVYITGRGNAIRIDEEVIVEEYPFFARNISNITSSLSMENVPIENSIDNFTDPVEVRILS
jgi:hypothetical protein